MVADALTSVLAIFALLAGKYYGLVWMDPAMGVVGSMLVGRWSLGLLRTTSRVLLDRQAPDDVLRAVRQAVEALGDVRVTDLHVWTIAPGKCAAVISVVASEAISAEQCKSAITADLGLAHVTVEVNPAPADTPHCDSSDRAALAR